MAETSQAHALQRIEVTIAPHIHWLVRAVLAFTFIFHGIDKFNAGLENVAAAFGFSTLVAFLVAAGEVAVGLALVVGGTKLSFADLSTRLGGVGMAIIMIGAISIVHFGRWAFAPAEGYPAGGMEYQMLLTAVGIFLAVRGNKF